MLDSYAYICSKKPSETIFVGFTYMPEHNFLDFYCYPFPEPILVYHHDKTSSDTLKWGFPVRSSYTYTFEPTKKSFVTLHFPNYTLTIPYKEWPKYQKELGGRTTYYYGLCFSEVPYSKALQDDFERLWALFYFDSDTKAYETLRSEQLRVNHASIVIPGEPNIDATPTLERKPLPVTMNDVYGYFKRPKEFENQGFEGKVVVRVLVTDYGNYVKHKIIASDHPALTKLVEENIWRLKFLPAVQYGKPVMAWTNIPFRFNFKAN